MRFLCQGRREVPDGRGENACESGRAGEPEQTSAGKREMFHADLLFFRVLTGRDFFHPCHAFAVFALTDGEVRHGAAGRRAVPVLHVWPADDHVSLVYGPDRPAPFLGKTGSEGDDKRLAEGMGMPVCAGTWFKSDVSAVDPLGGFGRKGRIDADRACEVLCSGRNRRG